MEWMLQIVDEIDDAIGAARQGWIGFNSEIGLWLGGGFAAAAVGTAIAAGYGPVVSCAAAATLSAGAAVKLRGISQGRALNDAP